MPDVFFGLEPDTERPTRYIRSHVQSPQVAMAAPTASDEGMSDLEVRGCSIDLLHCL